MSSKLEILDNLLAQHPHIVFAPPNSATYTSLREAYILDTPASPLAIARPQTCDDVALLVSLAVAHDIDISVRAGGHDLFGRCFVTGALCIDMRDICFVRVAEDRRSAVIGGGVLASHLARELGRHGLAAAVGSAPTVGWVGWATHGGYGPFAAHYGLGVDQILGARLVNCEGEVVEADEAMLVAIRGGGGCLGVIVELTIKVYPLKQLLGGVLVFRTDGFTATLKSFTTGYHALAAADHGLPDALSLQQTFVNTPMGKLLAVLFAWSSDDMDSGLAWLRKVQNLGHVLQNGVGPKTVRQWLDESGVFVPKTAYGRDCTVSVARLTDEAISVVGEHVARMPTDPATLFSMHELRGKSAVARQDSVFAARTPHFVLEMIATSSSAGQASEAWAWATAFRRAVEGTEAGNLLGLTYISLTPPEDADLVKVYGASWETLVRVKSVYDARNVFRHALPQFGQLVPHQPWSELPSDMSSVGT